MTRPHIVVLDGYTLNPGDLSWSALAELGSLEVHDRTPPHQIVERAAKASVVLTNKTPLDAASLAALLELRYVGVLATGTNIVDISAARARGIVVSNVPGYGADSVAEHTLSAMLDAVKHLGEHTRAVRERAWARQPDFSFTVAPVSLLADKLLGVVGFGAIGRRVVELALAFRMNVLVAKHTKVAALPSGARCAELDELFRESDFVSLHCPLTAETRHLIDARRLTSMKPSAILINTARGGLIDEQALETSLRQRQIRGAYLDVLDREPPRLDHPLTRLENCWVTPHIAWASIEARSRLLAIAVENLRSFLQGSPIHVVS